MFFQKTYPFHGLHFVNPAMVMKYIGGKGKNTITLGENMEISLDSGKTDLNNNILWMGGKELLIENIKKWHKNTIWYDDSNYYERYKEQLEESGYTVLKFDPDDLEHSISINPFSLIRKKSDIKKLSEIILHHTGEGKVNTKSSWELHAEMLYWNSILYHIWTDYPNCFQNFIALRDLFEKANYIEHGEWYYIDTVINQRQTKYGANDPSVRYYRSFSQSNQYDKECLYYLRKKAYLRIEDIDKISRLLSVTTTFPEENYILFWKPGYEFLLHILLSTMEDILIIDNENMEFEKEIPKILFKQQDIYISITEHVNDKIKNSFSKFDIVMKSGEVPDDIVRLLLKNNIGTRRTLSKNNNIVYLEKFGTVLLNLI